MMCRKINKIYWLCGFSSLSALAHTAKGEDMAKRKTATTERKSNDNV